MHGDIKEQIVIMGNVIFWIVFLGFIILIIVSGVLRSHRQHRDRVDNLVANFGTEKYVDLKENKRNFKGYFNHIKANPSDSLFIIDEVTSNDLNIDGLFKNINGTLSSAGEEYLYFKLNTSNFDQKSVYDFANIQDELGTNSEKRIKVQMALEKLGKLNSFSSFEVINGLFDAKPDKILPDILTGVLLVLSIAGIFIEPGIGVIAFIVMLIFAISSYFNKKARMDEHLRAFSYLIKMVRCSNDLNKIFDGDWFDRLKITSIASLSFLIPQKEKTASDPFTLIVDYIRMIFHVDLILYNLRLKTIVKNSDEIIALYEKIGYLDAALCVKSYSLYQPHVCRPKFTGDGLAAKEIYHPLTKNPVFNDISENKGALITGSNASGKSTFLKMIGINIIFSQSIGYAFASELNMKPVRLYSSMALSDNILKKESYYIVESKSLLRICEASKDESSILCLVDEVLRGTNTSERIAASCYILKYLQNNNVLSFVATHDTELTQLLKDSYNLYYFGEEVVNNEVIFPYKINIGVINQTNAIRLLDCLGYDENIIKEAKALIEYHKETGRWVN